MDWKFRLSGKAFKQLSKLDKKTAERVLKGLKVVRDSNNPRLHGKALKGELTGLWRYRFGNYRVICEIVDDEMIILALEIGHRREIYR